MVRSTMVNAPGIEMYISTDDVERMKHKFQFFVTESKNKKRRKNTMIKILIGVALTLWILCGTSGYLILMSRFSRLLIDFKMIKWNLNLEIRSGRNTWFTRIFEAGMQVAGLSAFVALGPIGAIAASIDRSDDLDNSPKKVEHDDDGYP